MLLEEEDIDIAGDLGQTGIACKIALFNRDATKLAFVSGEMVGNI